ncbi:hypothetical protein GCM10027436_10830 [Actinophytocola sediminis]
MAVATAAVTAAVVMGTGTASAANFVTVYQGDDYARFWTSSNTIYACDNEADGNGVYAEYWGSNSKHGTVSDGNGSKSGCGYQTIGVIDSFRACERNSIGHVCSGRVYL